MSSVTALPLPLFMLPASGNVVPAGGVSPAGTTGGTTGPLLWGMARGRLVVYGEWPATEVVAECLRLRVLGAVEVRVGAFGDAGRGVSESSDSLLGSSDAEEKFIGDVGGSTGFARLT